MMPAAALAVSLSIPLFCRLVYNLPCPPSLVVSMTSVRILPRACPWVHTLGRFLRALDNFALNKDPC